MNQKVLVDREKDREHLKKGMIDVAIKGLVNMFNNEKKLFCYRVKRSSNGLEKEGTSHRYTIMSLLGLHKYQSHGGKSPIDVGDTLRALIEQSRKIDNIGDWGLLLWLCAVASPGLLSRIFEYTRTNDPLSCYNDARQGRTMELAWFLTGLTYASQVSKEESGHLRDLAARVFNILRNNYGGKGIFGHQKKTTLRGMVRGRIGSFADQVYPIYALSKFGKAYDNKEALRIAMECGNAICSLQGPLGQWWWHYDSLTGKVIGSYPVYSVHQDGMAPMALFTLSEISGIDFTKYVYKGLEWVTGSNELGFDLVDTSQNVIWRSFFRKKYKMWCDEVLSLARLRKKEKEYKDLKVLFECRPYHLGWILYAFADKN